MKLRSSAADAFCSLHGWAGMISQPIRFVQSSAAMGLIKLTVLQARTMPSAYSVGGSHGVAWSGGLLPVTCRRWLSAMQRCLTGQCL